MNKKSILMLCVTGCFASSVFATNLFNHVMTKHNQAIPSVAKTHKMTSKTHRSYTDFSGTWTVDCGDGEFTTSVIENDADSITLDGQNFRIGPGFESQDQANEAFVHFQHTAFEWGDKGSSLIMKFVSVYRDNDPDQSPIQTMLGSFTMTMKNGQINVEGKAKVAEDLNQFDSVNMHCVYTKKQ